MISKTKINKRMRKKTNPELVGTIIKLKKTNPLIAKLLARPIKKQIRVNIEQIESKAPMNGNILIPGKVLGTGILNKKNRIIALSATNSAIEKIKSAKGEFIKISEEIKKNPELKDLVLIR